MTLTLGETWQPWHPSVRRGVLDEGHAQREVLVMLAAWQPSGVSRAREQVGSVLGLKAPDVLELLDIRNQNNRLAWIYDAADVVSTANLTGHRSLGHRAAAAVVLAAARSVARHGHPGPEPEDVLLTEDGRVRLANFVRPFPGIHGVPAPGSGSVEARQVFRLGALLAFLLGGPLPASSSREGHDAAIRRAQIRAMSRPGAVFSESYGNWLRAMLAWDPGARPPLSSVIEGLSQVVDTTAGFSLAETTTEQFTAWLIQLVGSEPDETTLPADLESLGDVVDPLPTVEASAGRRTLGEEHVLGDLDVEDDPTVDSELGVVNDQTPPSIIERGSIPVSVGPPAEVAAKRPSLPAGFLGDATEPVSGAGVPSPVPPSRPGWIVPVGVILVGLAVGMGIWLVWG